MRISTVIPAYNRADLIPETLRSILSQTRPPHELIVVDDGSTDGTPDAVAAFGKSVTLLRQSNAGAGVARNTGCARATGDIIHFMDSDDLCTLDSYAHAAAAMERGADMTYGPWLKARFDGRELDPEAVVLQQGPVPAARLDLLALLVDWVTVLQPCLFRREMLERAGPFRTDLKPSEDTELLYRLTRAARAPTHVPGMLVLYRVHEGGISQHNVERAVRDRANLWAVLQQHADQRADLDGAVRAQFRRKKYEVACEVREYDPAAAETLAADVGTFDRGTSRSRLLARKFRSRLRHRLLRDPYPPPMASGPLRPEQEQAIRELGYALRQPSGRGG
nr:glycosyltransferase family A protein [Novosphingobium flavum]